MNKVAFGNKRLIKAICLVLTCTFGVGLFSGDALANDGCGTKCCCKGKPMTQSHAPRQQIRSSMDCCAGSTQMPCDLVQATELHFPDIAIASAAGYSPNTAGSASGISCALIDRYDLRGHAFDFSARETHRASPLYLQNLSFLI
jgi:hypothetical protein